MSYIMSLKTLLLRIFGLSNPNHPLVDRLRRWRRETSGGDHKMRQVYLAAAIEPKLHLGASSHLLGGWLNADIEPQPGTTFLDATRRYPFAADTFAFAYAEHMIEHVTHHDGSAMLSECHRVLKPGGVVRLVTPNLDTILGLHSEPLSPKQTGYVDWMARTFTPNAPVKSSTFVINAMFRYWGHQFIYDEATLRLALKSAGFSNIIRCSIEGSDHPQLQNLANSRRYPDDLLEFESLCMEGTKLAETK